jgi:hypothetical protein
MKTKLIAIGIILLTVFSFITIYTLDAAGSVVIKSKGKAWVVSYQNQIKYGCDNSDEVVCTITIIEDNQ